MDNKISELANQILAGAEQAADTFNQIMKDRIGTAMDARKMEMASTLFTQGGRQDTGNGKA